MPTSGGIPLSNFEVSRSRRAYIDLTVELLSSAFPDSKNTVTALQMAPLSKEESPSSEPTSTPARAYALLVNSLIPAASQAVGSVVTTVSSMPLWNRVFGLGGQSKDELDDTLQRLVGVHGPYRGFCWRVCCLLKEMETCFESAGWGKHFITILGRFRCVICPNLGFPKSLKSDDSVIALGTSF